MSIHVALQPLIALIAGILILIVPRLRITSSRSISSSSA
jgi:hypothetical protein